MIRDEKVAPLTFFFRLEQEYDLFSNLKYFEEKIFAGEWDEYEKYLNDFTKIIKH